jgi:hypothetical protein
MKKLIWLLLVLPLLLVSACGEDEDIVVNVSITRDSDGAPAGNIEIKILGNELKGGLWPERVIKHTAIGSTNADGEARIVLPGDENIEEVELELTNAAGDYIDVLSGCQLYCRLDVEQNMKINLVVNL